MARVVTNAGALKAALLPGVTAASLKKATAGANAARHFAHVISGDMRRSIAVSPMPLGGARVSASAKQATFEEFGTRYRPPHPFMRPSMDAARFG